MLAEKFTKKVLPVNFSGTVHCEVSLMGMIVACKDEMTLLPNGMNSRHLRYCWMYLHVLTWPADSHNKIEGDIFQGRKGLDAVENVIDSAIPSDSIVEVMQCH